MISSNPALGRRTVDQAALSDLALRLARETAGINVDVHTLAAELYEALIPAESGARDRVHQLAALARELRSREWDYLVGAPHGATPAGDGPAGEG